MLLSKFIRTGLVTEPLTATRRGTLSWLMRHGPRSGVILGAPWPFVKWMPVRVTAVRLKSADSLAPYTTVSGSEFTSWPRRATRICCL